jgi:hypothetical protein
VIDDRVRLLEEHFSSEAMARDRVHGLINAICAFEQERSREDWEHLRRSLGQKFRYARDASLGPIQAVLWLGARP